MGSSVEPSSLDAILITHEHTDHTSGIFIFQDNFDCEIVCQKNCAKLIGDKRLARPLLIFFTLEERDRKFGTNLLHKFKEEYVYKTYQADITFDKEILLNLMGYQVEITHIPGHSKGSCLIKINNSIIFSGDSLMIGHPIITRFPGSEHKKFVEYSLPIFESLDRKLFVYPGHGFGFELNSMYVGDKLHIEYM